MMRCLNSSLFTLFGLLVAMKSAHANSFGNFFSTGPVSSGNFIRQANSTLVLPNAPNPVRNNLALWVGMGMSNGDLIQALALSQPAGQNDGGCGSVTWCNVASVLKNGANGQTEAPGTGGSPGDHITMSYIYNDGTNGYDQYVYLNGKLISRLSSSVGGKADGWGTAEECQPGTPCGVTPQHQWLDTVIVLNEADTGYGSTQGKSGASGSISSSDGGKTWKAATITINSFDFTTGQ